MNPQFREPLLLLLALHIGCGMLFAQTPASTPGSSSGSSQPAPNQSVSAVMQQEAAQTDITYLRSRLGYRYDYKQKDGDVQVNRFRFKPVYAFGPHKRLGLAVTVPVLYQDSAGDSAFGLGDIQPQFGGNFYLGNRFRTGAAVEFTLQTSTDSQLGGATTTAKPAWGFTALVTNRHQLNCTFNYKRSIHVSRGAEANEFEPDCTLNTRRLGATEFVEWDSYYRFVEGDLAQTMKLGVSRSTGRDGRYVIAPYVSFPLNDFGRQTQYIVQAGIDVTWFSASTGARKR